jgi:Retinal pigment epithelial membrane protein
MLDYAAKPGARSEYRFFRLGPDADEPQVVASAPTREPAYMHSFGLTERWIVLAEFPFVVSPLSLVLSDRPYIEKLPLEARPRDEADAAGPRDRLRLRPLRDRSILLLSPRQCRRGGRLGGRRMCTFDDAGLVEDLSGSSASAPGSATNTGSPG